MFAPGRWRRTARSSRRPPRRRTAPPVRSRPRPTPPARRPSAARGWAAPAREPDRKGPCLACRTGSDARRMRAASGTARRPVPPSSARRSRASRARTRDRADRSRPPDRRCAHHRSWRTASPVVAPRRPWWLSVHPRVRRRRRVHPRSEPARAGTTSPRRAGVTSARDDGLRVAGHGRSTAGARDARGSPPARTPHRDRASWRSGRPRSAAPA